jgi:hypothetical protein
MMCIPSRVVEMNVDCLHSVESLPVEFYMSLGFIRFF